MSQEKLGEAIGLTFQQVQKYERGSNRISAGTLYRLGQVLEVPVSFFFDGFEDEKTGVSKGTDIAPAIAAEDTISRRDARLLRLWRAAPGTVADEILALLSVLVPLADASQTETETVESSPPLVVPSLTVAPADDEATKRQRRRHGAVWDPADIYRAGRASRK